MIEDYGTIGWLLVIGCLAFPVGLCVALVLTARDADAWDGHDDTDPHDGVGA